MPAAGLSTQTGWTRYSVSAKSRCLKIQEAGSQFLKSRHRQGANSNKFWIKGENFKERRWWPHLSARVASKDGLCFKIMEGTSSALLVLRRAPVCLSSSQCWHYRCVPPCPAQLQSLIAFYRWGNQVLKVYILLIEDEISPKWLSRSISQTAWILTSVFYCISRMAWLFPSAAFVNDSCLRLTHLCTYNESLQVPSAQWRHILSHGSGVRDAVWHRVWAPLLFPCFPTLVDLHLLTETGSDWGSCLVFRCSCVLKCVVGEGRKQAANQAYSEL